MEIVVDPKYRLNLWNKNSIRPGSQSTVGEVNLQTRLKQSAPDLAPRYAEWTKGQNEVFYGSNVQDGNQESFMSQGLNARTVGRKLWKNRGFRTAVGWRHEDLVPPDKKVETKLAGNPQFGWKSQQSKIYKAKVSGENFLPLPGGYGPTELTRGTQYPLVIQRTAGDTSYMKRNERVDKDLEQIKDSMEKGSQGVLPMVKGLRHDSNQIYKDIINTRSRWGR